MVKKRRAERWTRKDEGHADKEARQLGEQAENGFTFHGACLSVSAPAYGWITIICSETPVKME